MNAKIMARMKVSMQRRADSELLERWVLEYLRQYGPTFYADLAVELNTGLGRMQVVAHRLKQQGILYVYPHKPGRDSRKVWSLEPKPIAEVKHKSARKGCDNWIEQEDIEWMKYWSQPRDVRRAMERMK